MVKGRNLDQRRKRADFPQAVNKLLVLKKQVENPNPSIPEHFRFRQRPVEERESLEQQWRRWDGVIGLRFFLLFNLMDATRMARMARQIYFHSRSRKNHSVFFQEVSLTSNSDSLVSDG